MSNDDSKNGSQFKFCVLNLTPSIKTQHDELQKHCYQIEIIKYGGFFIDLFGNDNDLNVVKV